MTARYLGFDLAKKRSASQKGNALRANVYFVQNLFCDAGLHPDYT